MRNSIMIMALVAGGIAVATSNLRAQSGGAPYQAYPQSDQDNRYSKDTQRAQLPPASLNFRASSIIGLPVSSDLGERLGKVQDLIVNMGADVVPFAIIEYGGALGIAETRIAVPLKDIRWSNKSKELTLAATKEQFEAASSAPAGGWVAFAGQEWVRNVDRFYGQPNAGGSRFERQETSGMNESRESVRTPADQTGSSSMQYPETGPNQQTVTTMTKPADEQLAAQVNALIQQNVQNGSRNIEVVIKNGVVTLRGRIPTQEQKELLEKQIKALPGVDRVQDSMITGLE
jgi:osmotically-inducible protein OsmY/sporulation protein YlmC with PRC-barrel domain